MSVLTALLISIQFILMSAFTAAVMAGLTVITKSIAAFHGEQLPWLIRASIGLLACLFMWFLSPSFFVHWWSWLPMLSFSFGRLAETFINQKAMRLNFLFAALTWFVYGILIGSFATIIFEGSKIICNLLSFRHITDSSIAF